ncbi:beta-ketoacyl synthase N-terminal-like domain-containing protein [Myroides odoratus]|uniref:beta-ketoacyl synthase N-terminal-like domain-containing protein n=1 Tax=Myroides odoratus TaxID=256 RepID=UPI000765A48C|nr:beta-ketoacyl synthase N-terminal-like domain-containing protein [Myroides odoratus]
MKKVYINGLSSISIQEQTRNFTVESLKKIEQGVNEAHQPSYKELIAPAMVRRMAKGVKMGIYTAHFALEEAQIAVPQAIITGTGLGCLVDSEKFLELLLENNESYLTPTSFIQSTHNTVGGQIALHLGCKGYNFTYVHQNSSFESALLDGFLQIKAEEVENALIGGIDEVGKTTIINQQVAELVNTADTVFEKGINTGEGATFFVLDQHQTQTSYAELVDIHISNTKTKTSLVDFLKQNSLIAKDIDLVFVGSCDLPVDQQYFDEVYNTWNQEEIVTYKEYVGHHHTASSFGLLLAAERMKKEDGIQYILLYNQFQDKDYSFILLKKC